MMKKLYEKSELGFALVWIGIYCVGMSIFDEISRSIGVESSATAVFGVAASLFLYFWLACVVYGYQIYLARHDAFWRYIDMKRRRQQRQG